MAEICETTDHDPYGDLEYCVEWVDNRGNPKARYFRSKEAADRYALRIEVTLLEQAVRALLAAHRDGGGLNEEKPRKSRNVH